MNSCQKQVEGLGSSKIFWIPKRMARVAPLSHMADGTAMSVRPGAIAHTRPDG